MSRPYEHHYERYDGSLRQQYPGVIPRSQPLQRPRRTWPPSPKAEDERVALAREYKPRWSDIGVQEVPFRGTIDQQPMLVDVNPQPRRDSFETSDQSDSDTESVKTTSSSESSGPSTPPDSAGRNQDQRYVYIPKKGIEIPLTYDEAREPKYAAAKPTRAKAEEPRGRIERPRIDTSVQDRKSEPLPPRERAPSPYTWAPKPKETDSRHFGDHLLSPEALNPGPQLCDENPCQGHKQGSLAEFDCHLWGKVAMSTSMLRGQRTRPNLQCFETYPPILSLAHHH